MSGIERWLGTYSTGCSLRVPGFDSQHPHGCSQPFVTPIVENPTPSSDLTVTRHLQGT